MNELKIFKNEVLKEQEVLGKHFRVFGTPEEPLFLAKDVAEWIEHSKASVMIETVDNNEKLRETIFTSGQKREVWFLTEDGLYEVLMQSRKPIAKQFKAEVKNILRSIRKHGAYMTNETLERALTSPDFLIKLATQLKEEKEKNKLLSEKNEEMKPKAIFADAVSASHTSIVIGDLAKIICQNGVTIGQKRLFEWLRNNGYLIKSGVSKNMPIQRYIEQGLFEVKESIIHNPNGSIRITHTTKVTGKGQIYFINKFLSQNAS